MRTAATILGLLIALCGGYVIYHAYVTRDSLSQAPPQEQIDIVGIKSELLAIGQAERQYFVAHSAYGTLQELGQESLLSADPNRRGYIFSVAVDGISGFTASATPSDRSKAGWPTLAIDQTMQITER
jgi:hypothetical protein